MASSKMGILLLLCLAFAASANALTDEFKAYLKGKNQVPAVKSKAWGWANIQIDTDMEEYYITFAVNGIKDMFAAHIHNGTAGTNGPVVLPLYTQAQGLPEGTSGAVSVTGESVTTYRIPFFAAPWMSDFLMTGRAYINVHTRTYPGGELRGQVNYVMPPPQALETIADVVGMYPELSTLLGAVASDPGLLAAATDPSTAVTLLAPTNAAFEARLAELGLSAADLVGNAELLNAVLSYHILPSVIPAAGVPATPGTDVPTLPIWSEQGYTVKAETTMEGAVVFDGVATVITADIMVNGGTSIIHIIDAVLIPPPPPEESIADVVGMYPELSTLLGAVASNPALLAAATDPSTAVTLLAPTNAAFEAALIALNLTTADLVGNQELLTAVLSYHALMSVIPAAGVPATPGADVPTLLEGTTVKAEMNLEGAVMFNGIATVTTADIMVEGGRSIIHIIDAVLLPPPMK